MTVIEKLSDRNNLIFNAVKLILVNEGTITAKQLQYKLFTSGIYIDGVKLKQVLSVMDEKGLLTKPEKVSTAKPEVKSIEPTNDIPIEVLEEKPESKASI